MAECGLTRGMQWAELARVAQWLNERVAGGRIQKIRQPRDDAMVLECRAPGQSYWVTLCIHPRFFRVVVETENPGSGSEAGAFCGLLRKRLVGGRIEEFAVEAADRIFTVNVSRRGEEDAVEMWTLVAELFGPKSNLFLLDGQGVLGGALVDRRLTVRGLRSGEAYQPPETGGAPQRADREMAIEEMAEVFAAAEAAHDWETALQKLKNAVSRSLKGARKQRLKHERELAGLPDADQLQQHAELLVTNLHRVERGAKQVELPDWSDPDTLIAVQLDPSLSPQRNVERMFKTARRTRRKREHLEARVAELAQREAQWNEGAALLETTDDLESAAETLRDMSIRLEKPKQPPPRQRDEAPAGPQAFYAVDGAAIFVGRSDRENDEITFQVAHGKDYWLHVEGGPGSHVVIKLPPSGELHPETLQDAAQLALLHSSLKNSGSGGVIYTRRKNVRKPRHAKPGLVHAGDVKSVFVRLDQARIDRLYQTRS
ncbi:MAG: NFACT RNA binding domain-containing protein [Candidatus Lernaella stagnicola]|nr:NFACT RNA binding domain-containing protein [Candidatus Lernaella stagnicola]